MLLLIFLLGGGGGRGGAYTRVIWGKRPARFWAQVHVQNEGVYTHASTVYLVSNNSE